MDGMSYEYLIRKAYNCGRGGASGNAEAGYYRDLEVAERAIEIQNSMLSLNELKYEFRVAASRVSNNIGTAIRYVINTHYFTEQTEEYKEKLEKLKAEISLCMDKKIIDKVIEETHDVFRKLDLKMG